WKDELAERIDLEPLSERDVGELADAVLGGSTTGPAIRWLYETSGGNPLYVRELIRGAVASASLSEQGGVWTLNLPWEIPGRLAELVDARVAELDASLLGIVEQLAVADSIGLALLAGIGDSHALEEAERHGLVSVRAEGRRVTASLVHPLYGEVLRHRTGALRGKRLAGILAKALAGTPMRRHDDAMLVARWQLDAGIVGDADLLSRAALRARQMMDMELAARIGKVAMEAGANVLTGIALGEALFATGHHQEAEEVLRAQVPRCSNDDELARTTRARVYNLGILIGDQERAIAAADEALAVITEPAARLQLLGQNAVNKIMSGDPFGALADSEEVVVGSPDEWVRMMGTFVQSWSLAMIGRTSDAIRVGTEARQLELQGKWARETAPTRQLVGLIMGLMANGRLERAADEAAAGYEIAAGSGDNDSISSFCLLRGMINVEAGDLGAAALWFRSATAIDRAANDLAMIRWDLGGTALADAMAGNHANAAAALVELEELPGHWTKLYDADLIGRGRAWTRAAAGETSAARSLLVEVADDAARRGCLVTEARLLHDVVRLGDAQAVVGRLRELTNLVDGSQVPAFAAHAAATVSGNGAS
ncbi:MAG TPA: hypothetical protein VGS21_07520, partial [Acidimicrobiales bacterium]|nr:hypothetical protein [Acidimicrobiales bacterium]